MASVSGTFSSERMMFAVRLILAPLAADVDELLILTARETSRRAISLSPCVR